MTLSLLQPVADKSYKSMTEIDRSPGRLLPTSNNRAATPQWGELLMKNHCSFHPLMFYEMATISNKSQF